MWDCAHERSSAFPAPSPKDVRKVYLAAREYEIGEETVTTS